MEIKKELLEIGETLTKDAVEGVYKLLEEFIKDDSNTFDDALIPFIEMSKPYVLGYVAKIDGE